MALQQGSVSEVVAFILLNYVVIPSALFCQYVQLLAPCSDRIKKMENEEHLHFVVYT